MDQQHVLLWMVFLWVEKLVQLISWLAGSYDKDTRRTTFMGAFPLDKPKYIMFLLLDEPKPTENSHGLATAGWNVAPTFSNIVIRRIAPMLDAKPSSIERLYDYDQIVVASN